LDPLAQLKDIHLPQQIHNYPLSIGWWLLALISLMLFVWTIVKIRRYQSQRKDQKTAIKQLKSMPLTNSQIISLLKWSCLQYFPRASSARLYGDDFRTLLIDALPTKKQAEFGLLSKDIFTNVYQSASDDSSNEQLNQAAIHWLKHALPPKNIDTTTKSEMLTGKNQSKDHDLTQTQQSKGEPA
jgi:hypothetical protein